MDTLLLSMGWVFNVLKEKETLELLPVQKVRKVKLFLFSWNSFSSFLLLSLSGVAHLGLTLGKCSVHRQRQATASEQTPEQESAVRIPVLLQLQRQMVSPQVAKQLITLTATTAMPFHRVRKLFQTEHRDRFTCFEANLWSEHQFFEFLIFT